VRIFLIAGTLIALSLISFGGGWMVMGLLGRHEPPPTELTWPQTVDHPCAADSAPGCLPPGFHIDKNAKPADTNCYAVSEKSEECLSGGVFQQQAELTPLYPKLPKYTTAVVFGAKDQMWQCRVDSLTTPGEGQLLLYLQADRMICSAPSSDSIQYVFPSNSPFGNIRVIR